jgi:hypothetical protein
MPYMCDHVWVVHGQALYPQGYQIESEEPTAKGGSTCLVHNSIRRASGLAMSVQLVFFFLK